MFLDLAKAFDSLPHQLVLESLARVGVQGSLYAWFEDYLSNRFQCVVLEGSRSAPAPAPVTSGVPQGSILGPLLFVLSMDTLSNVSISSTSSISMFADDILYWKRIYNNSDLFALQCDVDLIDM